MKRKRMMIGLSGILIVGVASFFLMGRNKSALSFHTAEAGNSTIDVTVMSTGYIQPVEEVEVGTQVSGVIKEIYVDYNSHVTAGQLLAELDRSTLEEKLSQANSTLQSAQSNLNYAQQNYDRVYKLHQAKAATDVKLEEAVNQLVQAKSTLNDAKANANQAKVNRDYAFIYSPINGVILSRAVNVGQTVAASFNTPTLFTIAEDLTKMQVEVDVDEADIGDIRVGQSATFTVDAYNEEYFTGTVSQIRLQPTITSNVVTYTVIVDAPNPEEKLFPGMTANITIKVKSQQGVSVPLEALNFKMTQDNVSGYQLKPLGVSSTQNTVWVLKGNLIEERALETGLNDGVNVIVDRGLEEGERVILSTVRTATEKSKQPTSLMPGPPK